MAVQTGRTGRTQRPRRIEAKRRIGSQLREASEPGAEDTAPAFVGRDDVLARVADALDRGPALVLIEGEPGIGKTRLLREALAVSKTRAADRGNGEVPRVLVGACPALTDPFPLTGVVEGLRRFVRAFDVHLARIGLSELGGALRPLFPEWARELPPALDTLAEPREVRHRLLRALTELVERLNIDVLVVEDAHWADAATLEWLLTLTTVEPVDGEWSPSIIVSYRPAEVAEGSLLLRLRSRPPAALERLRVELSPLDVEQTRRLVASMFHTDEVSAVFAQFLHERTDGLPLAVEECVRLLRDRRDIVRTGDQWSRRALSNLEVPPTVRDSVLERLTRLPPDVRGILQAAAVLADPSEEQLLTCVAGLKVVAGQRALTSALASGLLRETGPGRFAFRHILDEQAVAGSIQSSDWRRMHARAAEALEHREPEPVVRLARHHRDAGNTEPWCRYAEASAELALESGDDRTAVTILLDLLTTADHPADRRVRLARKVSSAARSGFTALGDLLGAVVDAIRAVLGTDGLSRLERGELRYLLGRQLSDLSDERAANEEMRIAVADLEEAPALAAHALMNLARPLSVDWPAATHLAWLERAVELLPRIDTPLDRLKVAVNRATVLLLLGEEAGWKVVAELPVSASTAKERATVITGQANAAQAAAMVWHRYEDARHRLAAVTELMQAHGLHRMLNSAHVAGAYLDWWTGHWDGLRAVADELAISNDTYPADRLWAQVLIGLLDMASGANAAAEARLRTVVAEYARLNVIDPTGLVAAAAVGRLRLRENDVDGAVRESDTPMTLIARKGVWLWASDTAPVHVEALAVAGRIDEAAALVEQFAAGMRGRTAPASAAATALIQCRAVIAEARADQAEASALFAEAAGAWAALPRPYDELLALERHGTCLLGAGKEDEAIVGLSKVQERLWVLGAKWDADRVAHLLRKQGVEVIRPWRGGKRGYGDQLSPRELEVVDLAARGMTNQQIAATLFISHKTVARHLTVSMRKLGVSSRTALAMAASEAGFLVAGDRR